MARRGYDEGGGYWEQFRARPRLAADGIRAQTQRGQFGKSWWASRWIAALERLVDPGRLTRGRSYARSGQVLNLDVSADGVAARVQGSRRQPYDVSIKFRHLDEAAWEQVADAMAAEALYAAKLLSGEMPSDIEDVFRAAGTSLFPAAGRDLETGCSCPDWANPCKHVAAVHYLLGERFETDPFLIFLLRGRSQDSVAEMLRARRAGGVAAGVAPADDGLGVEADEAAPALSELIGEYWGSAELAGAAVGFVAPPVDGIAVKRLGPPPFWPEPARFEALVTTMYRTIGAHAYRVAMGPGEGTDLRAARPSPRPSPKGRGRPRGAPTT